MSSSNKNIFSEILLLGPLFFCTFIGIILRIILSEFSTSTRSIAFDSGSPLNPVLLPNVVGCFIMGLIQHPFLKKLMIKYLGSSIHTGISTGLAGSLTSFSSWVGYSITLLFFFYPSWPEPIIDVFWCYFIGWSTSYLSLIFGLNCVSFIEILISKFKNNNEDKFSKEENEESKLNDKNVIIFTYSHYFFLFLCWTFYIILLIGAIFIAIFVPSFRLLSIAIISGQFGTYIRYFTSKKNTLFPNFPIMTFSVNLSGCIIFIILTIILQDLISVSTYSLISNNNTPPSQVYIPSFLIGFCGSLTTVSSFINETYKLKSPYNYIYGWATLLLSFVICAIIFWIYLLTT